MMSAVAPLEHHQDWQRIASRRAYPRAQRSDRGRQPSDRGSAGGVVMGGKVTREVLKGFLAAFNDHDLDAIMSYFAEDCVFYMPRGASARGDRFVGKDEVRAGLAK